MTVEILMGIGFFTMFTVWLVIFIKFEKYKREVEAFLYNDFYDKIIKDLENGV